MSAIFLLLGLVGPIHADQLIAGDAIRIYYSGYGVWNSGTYGCGFQMWDDDRSGFDDVTYPGSPWQQISIQYVDGTTERTYSANYGGSTTWTVLSEADDSADDLNVSVYTVRAGNLEVTKTETWYDDDTLVNIWFTVTNIGSTDLTDFILMHGVDPDQDSTYYSTTNTYIDRMDLTGVDREVDPS